MVQLLAKNPKRKEKGKRKRNEETIYQGRGKGMRKGKEVLLTGHPRKAETTSL